MILDSNYREKAGVIVYDPESRFLLVKNSNNGKVGFPKGTCEVINGKIETLEDCAIRELKEETSLELPRESLDPNNTWYKEHTMFFIVQLQNIPKNLRPLDREIQNVIVANISDNDSNYNRPLRQFKKALDDNTINI